MNSHFHLLYPYYSFLSYTSNCMNCHQLRVAQDLKFPSPHPETSFFLSISTAITRVLTTIISQLDQCNNLLMPFYLLPYPLKTMLRTPSLKTKFIWAFFFK
jgi:hypothetical protein